MQIVCGNCRKLFVTERPRGGAGATCPECGNVIELPADVSPPPPPLLRDPAANGDAGFAAVARRSVAAHIDLECAHCRKRLMVGKALAGKRVRCPACGQSFVVPHPSQQAQFVSGDFAAMTGAIDQMTLEEQEAAAEEEAAAPQDVRIDFPETMPDILPPPPPDAPPAPADAPPQPAPGELPEIPPEKAYPPAPPADDGGATAKPPHRRPAKAQPTPRAPERPPPGAPAPRPPKPAKPPRPAKAAPPPGETPPPPGPADGSGPRAKTPAGRSGVRPAVRAEQAPTTDAPTPDAPPRPSKPKPAARTAAPLPTAAPPSTDAPHHRSPLAAVLGGGPWWRQLLVALAAAVLVAAIAGGIHVLLRHDGASEAPPHDAAPTESVAADADPRPGPRPSTRTAPPPPPATQPAVKLPPPPPPPPSAGPKARLLAANGSVFLHEGYRPAGPRNLFLTIEVELFAGASPFDLRTDAAGISLEIDGKTYAPLTADAAAVDLPPVPRAQDLHVPAGGLARVRLLFEAPASVFTAVLRIAGVDEPVRVRPDTTVTSQGQWGIEGTYEELPPRNLKPELDDPVMAALQRAGNSRLVVRDTPDGVQVELPAAGVTGTGQAVKGERGLWDVTLHGEGAARQARLRLFADGKRVLLYLADEPFHQITYRRM